MPRQLSNQHPGNEELFESKLPTKKPGTCQPGVRVRPGGSESYPDEGNTLTPHCHQESESLERKKYALSKDAGTSPDPCIPSPQPIDKSKRAPEPAPSKKKTITVDEYWARGEQKRQDKLDQAHLEAQCLEREHEATCKFAEMRRVDKEDHKRLAKMRELKKHKEKAKEEAARAACEKMAQEDASRMAESPPRDENDEELDYYDDVERDAEMSSQETVPMSSQDPASQEMAPASNQDSASHEMVPTSSQDSASQDTASMPSQDSTTDATIIGAVGGTLMEDETCFKGPTLRCTPAKEVLLDLVFKEALDQLIDTPLGYLAVLAVCIEQIRKNQSIVDAHGTDQGPAQTPSTTTWNGEPVHSPIDNSYCPGASE